MVFSSQNKIFVFTNLISRKKLKLCLVNFGQVRMAAFVPYYGGTLGTNKESQGTYAIVSGNSHAALIQDPAVLYVGRNPTLFNQTYYCRRTIPFSSLLLQNSCNVMEPLKRKQHMHAVASSVKKPKADEVLPVVEQSDLGVSENSLGEEYGIKRHWELTHLGREQIQTPRPGFEFFVMSYNILAQNLLEDNQYLYQESPDYVLDWKFRSEKLLLEIKALNAEVLCLQEVNSKHYEDFFEPNLKALGYQGVYVKRTGDKMDGCATFYKTEKFTLEESVPVQYYKSNCSLLDRDNVGLIMKLRPNKNACTKEDTVCIANTHLLFNPRRGDVKLAQVMCLLAEIDRISKVGDNARCQVMVCGDFNATPLSDLYKFMIHGYLKYEGLVTRLISGQKEGQMRGSNRSLSKSFFPSRHKISDQCRHIKADDHHKTSVEVIDLTQDDSPHVSQASDLSHFKSPHVSQASGCLWHSLNLVSTYRHTIERLGHGADEVTTQHSADNCIVDYIFYGVSHRDVHTRRSKHRSTNVQEGKLKLLGRWGLMSAREIRALGDLPNHYHPSDHLPLVVKMLLV